MTTARIRWTAWTSIVTAIVVALVLVVATRDGTRRAEAATDTSSDTVTVTGVGTASGAPDTLSADFRVHVTRGSVQDALDAQGAATRRLLSALQKAGVTRSRLRTTDLELNQHYDNHGNVSGYDASETIRARITPLSQAGRTLSAGATSAGNAVEVGSLAFDIADDDSLVSDARANAFADAKSRAEQYAGLAGRSLGRVQRVTEHVDEPAPTPYYGSALYDKAAGTGATASVPVRGGKQTLTVRVSVVWTLS
jgi:uncharacterized protein YggE